MPPSAYSSDTPDEKHPRGAPWEGTGSVPQTEGGWQAVAPSDLAFGDYAPPRPLSQAEVAEIPGQFAAAARRALSAGFDVIELHLAHGYLMHQFYSPLSNTRTDSYGGDFNGRTRLALEVTEAVRHEAGDGTPVFARLSASDWAKSGWTIEDSVHLAGLLADRGVDLIDTSSGGNTPDASIPVGPGYQVPFAERIRSEAMIATGAVGMITAADQAEEILASGAADVVFLARAMLRDPHWALRAANTLGEDIAWPSQYARARNWH
jgi:2,4-dienoyl-CoA reductase-like NADH-dependent reductase (Old Yellow Enzyme family)